MNFVLLLFDLPVVMLSLIHVHVFDSPQLPWLSGSKQLLCSLWWHCQPRAVTPPLPNTCADRTWWTHCTWCAESRASSTTQREMWTLSRVRQPDTGTHAESQLGPEEQKETGRWRTRMTKTERIGREKAEEWNRERERHERTHRES